MKKILLLVYCVLNTFLLVAGNGSNEKCLRDSIFNIYHSMREDTARVQFLASTFLQHIDQDWSVELLDTALALTVDTKDVENELVIRYEYFRYYTFRMDGENMEKKCSLLKEASYRYEIYDNYFLALHYILQLKSTQGNTEYAIQASREMRKEAIRLKVDHGIFLSYITEGKSYAFARKSEKAIELYKEALKLPRLSMENELMVHMYLATSYYFLGNYEETKNELEMQRKNIAGIIKKYPLKSASYRSRILEIELMYCKIYLAETDVPNLKKHLDEAAKFYSDDYFSSLTINYNFSWAGYYYLIEDWDKCFPQFELTLSVFKGTQPMYEADIRRVMGDAYRDAKRYKEAAETYKAVVLKVDSLNKSTLRMNQETVQANYRIQKALLEKETGKKRFWQVAVGGMSLLIMLLVVWIIHMIRMRRKLLLSKTEMRESYVLVSAADKMKEVFLRNITNEIRGPLDLVVTYSDNLCQRDNLSLEQQQKYSAIIKQNAGKLIDLIFNILDLSRLEAGMMKFNVHKYDLVRLCNDIKSKAESCPECEVQISFYTELKSLFISVDTDRFTKLLLSVLTPPRGNSEPCKVEFTLLCEENGYLKIKVVNSPLLRFAGDGKESEILHAINRLYLEYFKGNYQLCEQDGVPLIIITYPIN